MSDNQPLSQVIISRTETFSASHRLHSPYLTDEENKELYGKCNNFNGHGHNYKVDVMLKGPVDPATGMVINITDMKKAMNRAVMDVLDHKNIDKDVPYFGSIPSTAENISVFIWNQMKSELTKINKEHLLYQVKLFETEKNVFYYRGEKS